ncbi:MAG: DNA mismatch repair endonuclease MutL [Nitrospirota bacterium]
MPQIKILPIDLRNKIAAGEVIERPASVVKELIENSIDAGSTDIRVDVLYGGKRLIKVSDNGAGMDREDALLCFERHATSKLATEHDLFDIKTMGFRGEALSSIASVAKIKLVTGLKGSPAGVQVEVDGGKIGEIRDAPSVGTSIEVRDLFFNTPVRKKFLKATSTELFHIIDTVTKNALSYPGIGFRLLSDNHETMQVPVSSGRKERILQIYGEEFLAGLMELNAGISGIKLEAYISKGENFRNSRSHQVIFINGRPVKDQSISSAMYKAYEGILPQGRHPIFFLFMEIDPAKVDVNVHPTKREVRFQDRESVYRFVLTSVREVIRKERGEYTKQFATPPAPDVPPPPYAHNVRDWSSTYRDIPASMVAEAMELAYRPMLPHLYLGETFVAVSGKGGLTLIDHHAAHERILYEKFLKGLNIGSHRLLFPRQIKLSAKEYTAVMDNLDVVRDFGIDIDDFGFDTVIVRSLPDALEQADMRGILADVASSVLDGIAPGKSLKEELAARIACHSSVRGKEILTQEGVSQLIADLEQTENPDQCPHGRPTRIFFSLDDLKKMFKRK